MLQAAKKRLHGFDNVELRRGDLEALPIDDARLDAATLALVLHHLPEPERALAEVARVLKPGGRLLIVDMLPHDRESYRQQMGHVWLGFSEEHVRRILDESGFGDVRIVPLSPDPKSKGPGLFVATAKKRTNTRSCTKQIAVTTKAEPRSGEGTAREVGPRATKRRDRHHAYCNTDASSVRRRESRRPRAVQGEGSVARRVRPQGAAARRAGDARPDGAAQAVRRARSRSPARASWAACT